MRQLSLFVEESRALDVFAYRGKLFVLTYEGAIQTYDVSQLAQDLAAAHGDTGLVIAYGLFSSIGIGASPEMKAAWKNFDHASSHTLSFHASPASETRSIADASVYVDMRIYYNRLYLATDRGTFATRLDADGRLSNAGADMERLTTERTESLSTGMGAVGASLGDEGLAIFTEVGGREPGVHHRIERRSLRSSIGGGRSVNYPTHSSFESLSSTINLDALGRRTLVDVAASTSDADKEIELSEGSYAIWEAGRLLIGDETGVTSLGRMVNKKSRQVSSATRRERPLSLGVTGNRIVVTESPQRITAARGDQEIVLREGPAVSVRTFSGSRRYKRLIAATVEGGLLLSAVFLSGDDELT